MNKRKNKERNKRGEKCRNDGLQKKQKRIEGKEKRVLNAFLYVLCLGEKTGMGWKG